MADKSGIERTSITPALPRATGTGWRITPCARRYQPPDSSDTDGPLRIDSELIRVPSSASAEGTTRRATTADRIPTAAPATPTEYRNRCGRKTSPASATATVKPEKSAVRPAVATVRRWASRVGPSRSSSSR